jgi:hypothetical protein
MLAALAIFCVLCHFAWAGLWCSLVAGACVWMANKDAEADLDDEEGE